MNSLPETPPGLKTLTPDSPCSRSICKHRFSEVGFSIWDRGARGLILRAVIFRSKCYPINRIFSLVLASLEENHLQDEGVCSLAKGLERNSSLKVLK